MFLHVASAGYGSTEGCATLTRDALMGYVHSPDPELRAAAYQELYRVYEGEAKVLDNAIVGYMLRRFAAKVHAPGQGSDGEA